MLGWAGGAGVGGRMEAGPGEVEPRAASLEAPPTAASASHPECYTGLTAALHKLF